MIDSSFPKKNFIGPKKHRTGSISNAPPAKDGERHTKSEISAGQ
jgi:hypothetical protein